MNLPQSNEVGAIADRARETGGSIEETEERRAAARSVSERRAVDDLEQYPC